MQKREQFRNTSSKDGSLSVHLKGQLASRVRSYCQEQNVSILKFIETCVSSQLDNLERESLLNMPKEMLIELYLTEKNGK